MATSRFWVSFSRILVGLYLICFFLEPKDFATAGFKEILVEPDNNDTDNDAQFEVLTHDSDDPLTNGSVSTAGNGDGARYELCGNDLSFLGPPYGNISTSNMVCSPIWNTFVLRVSCFNSYFLVMYVSLYIVANLNELNLIS